MKTLFGVITAMTTPFTADGQVDTEALEQQTDFLIDKGVNCLYPCGTTGEMYLMDEAERKLVAETVVRRAAGRVTVFIHCGAMHEDEVVRLCRHARAIGADGVGVVTPSYFGVNPRAMVEYYRRVCSQLPEDFPVYVYVIPQLAMNDIDFATMQQIADACPNVVGVKYSFADMRRFTEYLKVRGGKFSVVFGPDDLFLPALVMGCEGTVSGCSSCIPEPFVEIYRLFRAGEYDKARQAQLRCFDMTRVLKGGSDMSVFKNVQTLRGVRGGHVRKPLLDLPEAEVQALKEAIAPYLPKN
ncbi:MAG TPA: dihydrodipicolinate synthase family protein [Candidatus Pullichristensenella excrementigallinarum]|uniref:Dihydrodipicolinate synthase family protein n=1 Tax=Candidatus Pullichristensenella excrementigallinarum TaxID=2840907 RepID=A0A9D1LB94_9FIRM|nr:dihydrodipicolinate synthase family protein [Candidatus Pullichristensenella excrementigallinarum]